VPSGRHSSTERIAWISGTALAVFVLWLLVNSSGGGGIGFFYAIPIGLASWWFGTRAGIVAALACCSLYVIGALIEPVTSVGVTLAVRVVAFAGVIFVVSLFRKRLTVLEHSAEELDAIRAALTPSALPDLPGVDAAAAFVPSELGVSGDFYLLTNGPDDSTVAVVGDVVGHGPKAARLATFIRARFAALAASTSDPVEILSLANDALLERGGHRKDELASAVCLRYRPDGALVTCAVAGHPPPLRLPSLEELEPHGHTTLLGVRKGAAFATVELRLEDREGMLVYTDGATDVRRAGGLLGVEGLADLLGPLAQLPARALAREAQRTVLEWADGPIRDDLCVVVLRPEGAYSNSSS